MAAFRKSRNFLKQLRLLTGLRKMAHSSKEDDVRLVDILRIYNDKNGNSQFRSFKIEMKGSGTIGYLSEMVHCEGVIFRETPADYNYSWHNAPRRQFIVNLDADVEIEVSSGEKRVIKQGEIFFVEDVAGKGHYSRSVDGRSRRSLFIPVKDNFLHGNE